MHIKFRHNGGAHSTQYSNTWALTPSYKHLDLNH